MSDRSRIEVYLELGWSISRIAKEIKFSKQAISREVRRNQNRQGNCCGYYGRQVN
ncbi:helix-turn-helix domain-containing protein [Candidatus Saccharibacteria bacterium]|nr:helix-turn-helix domain-containing protein [Candidatus Saccharibacteria bacterium]